jgi:transcriptional regulator with XRE-family HTH domain
VGGRRVPWLAGIHDDHRPLLARQLQRGSQPGSRPADHRDVAVPLDDPWGVIAHDPDDTLSSENRMQSCEIRKSREAGFEMGESDDIERLVRTRLRSLRQSLGLSLDELATRSGVGASTISRIETGKRTISLDVLLPLAAALQVDLDALLDVRDDDDVVIRPTPSTSGKRTTWMLNRPTGSTLAIKMRLEPTKRRPEQRVHPGRDWFFVLEGRVRLWLGDRTITVETGEAAEFATMTPHAFAALDGAAELIMIFDRDGQHAHVHRDARPGVSS